MSDLICGKTMQRCYTPGMCAPVGGCSTPAEAARKSLAIRAVAPAPAAGVPGVSGVKRAKVWEADYSWPDDLEVVPADCYDALAAERDQLRAEVEALRKDAERYRWLRERGGASWHILETGDLAKRGFYDSAIDDAMAAKEGV